MAWVVDLARRHWLLPRPDPGRTAAAGTGCAWTCRLAALRRAARAHPRAAAIGTDIWQHLPLAADSAAVVLSVFGPRNPAEIDRILKPDGTLIIAVPGPAHLRELRRPLGLIGIDRRKTRRLADAFRGYARSGATRLRYRLTLDHAALTALVTMGPSARHIAQEALAARIHALPRPRHGHGRPADQGLPAPARRVTGPGAADDRDARDLHPPGTVRTNWAERLWVKAPCHGPPGARGEATAVFDLDDRSRSLAS